CLDGSYSIVSVVKYSAFPPCSPAKLIQPCSVLSLSIKPPSSTSADSSPLLDSVFASFSCDVSSVSDACVPTSSSEASSLHADNTTILVPYNKVLNFMLCTVSF